MMDIRFVALVCLEAGLEVVVVVAIHNLRRQTNKLNIVVR